MAPFQASPAPSQEQGRSQSPHVRSAVPRSGALPHCPSHGRRINTPPPPPSPFAFHSVFAVVYCLVKPQYLEFKACF
jgi:hypothetical protein